MHIEEHSAAVRMKPCRHHYYLNLFAVDTYHRTSWNFSQQFVCGSDRILGKSSAGKHDGSHGPFKLNVVDRGGKAAG
jgi:hypothetical protein